MGYAVIGTFDGSSAGHITIKIVSSDEPSILSPKPGEYDITDLVIESATPQTTSSTLVP